MGSTKIDANNYFLKCLLFRKNGWTKIYENLHPWKWHTEPKGKVLLGSNHILLCTIILATVNDCPVCNKPTQYNTMSNAYGLTYIWKIQIFLAQVIFSSQLPIHMLIGKWFFLHAIGYLIVAYTSVENESIFCAWLICIIYHLSKNNILFSSVRIKNCKL